MSNQKQRRTIKTPCCNHRVKIVWPRGWEKAQFRCQFCGKRYDVHFSILNGSSHKVIKKVVKED